MGNSKERVVHPNHYNRGIEMWDYAHSHKLDFFEGNIVKYVTRWKDTTYNSTLKPRYNTYSLTLLTLGSVVGFCEFC